MDCRQRQRQRYEPQKLSEGRTRLKQQLEVLEGSASVKIEKDALSRTEDNEVMDKYYIALEDFSNSSEMLSSINKFIYVYRSSVKGTTLELTIPHSSYIHLQDTLSNRIQRNRSSIVEMFICVCIMLFIIKAFIF